MGTSLFKLDILEQINNQFINRQQNKNNYVKLAKELTIFGKIWISADFIFLESLRAEI